MMQCTQNKEWSRDFSEALQKDTHKSAPCRNLHGTREFPTNRCRSINPLISLLIQCSNNSTFISITYLLLGTVLMCIRQVSDSPLVFSAIQRCWYFYMYCLSRYKDANLCLNKHHIHVWHNHRLELLKSFNWRLLQRSTTLPPIK